MIMNAVHMFVMLRCFTEFSSFGANYVTVIKVRSILSATEM